MVPIKRRSIINDEGERWWRYPTDAEKKFDKWFGEKPDLQFDIKIEWNEKKSKLEIVSRNLDAAIKETGEYLEEIKRMERKRALLPFAK